MTFPPSGIGIPTVQSLNVTIIDDMAVESDHSFILNITGTSLAAVTAGSPSSITLSIIDNDGQLPSRNIHLITSSFKLASFSMFHAGEAGRVCMERVLGALLYIVCSLSLLVCSRDH